MTKRAYLISAACVVAVAIFVPTAALALAHHGTSSGPPRLEPTQSQRLAHAVTAAGSVDVDSVPNVDGQTCIALTLPDSPKQGIGNGGMSCSAAPSEPTAAGMNATMSWVQINGQNVLIIFGQVGSAITQVRLQMPDGSIVQAATSHGIYVTRLTAPAVGVLPGTITATGYDSSGQPAASVDLQKILTAATPPPSATP